MRKLGALLVLLAIGACGTEEELVDPVGSWLFVATPTTGTCNITEPSNQILKIERGPSGGYVIVDDSNVTITGTMICNVEKCDMNATASTTITNAAGTITGAISYVLTLNDEGKISGSETITLSGAATCVQQYTVAGSLQ